MSRILLTRSRRHLAVGAVATALVLGASSPATPFGPEAFGAEAFGAEAFEAEAFERPGAPVDSAAAGSAPVVPWAWPLAPRPAITRPYLAPATRYTAGHRGIDMQAREGDAVLAPAPGIVTFAGMVAGRPVLSIAHLGDVISSVEPVVAGVRVGDAVARGQPVGVVASGGHCTARCVHWGVRLHGAYVSPLLFLAGIPRAVLLSPPEE